MNSSKMPIIFEEININNYEKINYILGKTGIISNFTCFPQLWSFLVKENSKLYISKFNNSERIILIKTHPIVDIRILFKKENNDNMFIDYLIDVFNPKYLAYNLITEVINHKKKSIRNEVVYDVNTIAKLKIKKLKKDFVKCTNNHQLIYRRAKTNDKTLINNFLYEWCKNMSEKLSIKVTGENDYHLINNFLTNKKLFFGIGINKNKVVALECHTDHPVKKNLAVSIITKNLRGYKKLGQWITVKQSQELLKEGFTNLLVGGTEVSSQATFKKQFLKNGEIHQYQSYEVFNKSDIDLPQNHLRDFWS